MNNIIVNSALWYAEQSNQFLIYSGADKLLGKGFDYYAAEFIPLEEQRRRWDEAEERLNHHH